MPERWIAGAVALCTVLCLPLSAGADDKIDYAAAKAHYTAAEKALTAGEFDKAATEYQAAYNITGDPILFFKLGQAYKGAGKCPRAVGFFQRYLAQGKPSQEFVEQTRALIEECKAEEAEKPEGGAAATAGEAAGGASSGSTSAETETPEGAETETPEGAEADSEPSPPEPEAAPAPEGGGDGEEAPSFLDEDVSWQRTAAWTSVGLAVAFVTAGTVLGLSASSREEDIDNLLAYRDSDGEPETYDGTIQERYDELVDEGERLETLSLVAFGIAGAATIAAATFFVLDQNDSDWQSERAAVVPTAGRDSVGVSAALRF